MQKVIQGFLENEISDQEFYDGIISFIYSNNIRCGEYEGNLFVIKKIDPLNFIIFEEFAIDSKREIHNAFSIQKSKLLRLINDHAEKQGFELRSFD